jgi:hypothetical protein
MRNILARSFVKSMPRSTGYSDVIPQKLTVAVHDEQDYKIPLQTLL